LVDGGSLENTKQSEHASTKMARAIEEALGVKGEKLSGVRSTCKDVPNFLKSFEERQRRNQDKVCQFD